MARKRTARIRIDGDHAVARNNDAARLAGIGIKCYYHNGIRLTFFGAIIRRAIIEADKRHRSHMLVERILLAVIGNGVALGLNDLFGLFLNLLFALVHAVIHKAPTGSSNRTNHEQHDQQRADTAAAFNALNRLFGASTTLRSRFIKRRPLCLITRLRRSFIGLCRCVGRSLGLALGFFVRLSLHSRLGLPLRLDGLRHILNLLLGIAYLIFVGIHRIDKVLATGVHDYFVSWSLVNTPLTI